MSDSGDTHSDPDRDAMYRAFEESPGDLVGYGAMADRLQELGYDALAHAFRWMQRRGKFPHKRTHYVGDLHQKKVPAKFRWAWYAETTRPNGREVPSVLPGSTLKLHTLSPLLLPGSQKVFLSHQAAVMALADWLKELRDVWDLDPPKKEQA